jgi:hypothetical protein
VRLHKEFEQTWSTKVAGADDKTLVAMLRVKTIEGDTTRDTTGVASFSHMFLRLQVDNPMPTGDLLYGANTVVLKPASKETLDKVRAAVLQMTLDDLLKEFAVFANSPATSPPFHHLLYETLFEKVLTRGKYDWHCREMTSAKGAYAWVASWSTKQFAHMKVEAPTEDLAAKVKFLKPGTLVRLAEGFPFVDFVWKEKGGKLCAAQVTMSPKHPKEVSVYNDARRWLGLKNETLHVYYVMMPAVKDAWSTKQTPTRGFFWKGAKDLEVQRAEATITFGFLIPPVGFWRN